MRSRWTTSSQLPQAPQRSRSLQSLSQHLSRLLQSLSRHQSQFPPNLLPVILRLVSPPLLRSRPPNLLPSLLQRRSPHQSRPIRLMSPHRNLPPLPNLLPSPLPRSLLRNLFLPIRSRNLLPSPLPRSLLRNLFLPIRSRNLLPSPPTRSQSPLRKLLLSPYPPSPLLSRLPLSLVPLMLYLTPPPPRVLPHPLQSLLLSTRSQSPRRKNPLLLPRRLVSLLLHPLPSPLLPTRSASLRLPSPRQTRPLPKKGRRSRLPRYTSPLRSPRPPDRRANRSLNRSPIRRRG
jgi:hypothetical protein